MTFPIDNVYLSTSVAYGNVAKAAVGAIETLHTSASTPEGDGGKVGTNEHWSRVRRSWVLSWDLGTGSIVETLFEVNRKKYGFLFIPPRERDYAFTGQSIGTGNGSTTAFQLKVTKSTYDNTPTLVRSAVRTIKYPLNNSTLKVYLNGVLQVSGYTVSYTTGIITFAVAPSAGVLVTADFNAAYPVRFTSDSIDVSFPSTNPEDVAIQSVTIEEVF